MHHESDLAFSHLFISRVVAITQQTTHKTIMYYKANIGHDVLPHAMTTTTMAGCHYQDISFYKPVVQEKDNKIR